MCAAASFAISSRTSPTTMFAPASASLLQIARPIPRAPPVTTALRPFSDISSAIDFPLTSGMAIVHPPCEINEKQHLAVSQTTIIKRQRKESICIQPGERPMASQEPQRRWHKAGNQAHRLYFGIRCPPLWLMLHV